MTHSPALRGAHVSLAYRHVFKACEYEAFIHQPNDDATEAEMVMRFEEALKNEINCEKEDQSRTG